MWLHRDVEQFIWPNLLLMYPSMARAAMQYRFDTIGAARENAKTLCDTNCTGNCNGRHCAGWPCSRPRAQSTCNITGLKYAWESATTGYAACPACCTVNELEEIHISGDVSLAMWQTWQASHDLAWLQQVGWPVIKGGTSPHAASTMPLLLILSINRVLVHLCYGATYSGRILGVSIDLIA